MTQYRLSKDKLDDAIRNISYHKFSDTGTLCVLTLQNGYTVTGESGCIDPTIFNENIGKQIAYDNAYDKLWAILGYNVKQQWHDETQLGWQAKLKLELADLDAKRTKLDTLLQGNKPDYIPQRQWDLMEKQNEVMTTYAMILQERIVS